MLKKITSFATTAALFIAAAVQSIPVHADSTLIDSGISYVEEVGTIQNPGAGYTTTVWADCAPGETRVYEPNGSIVLFFINIGQFSSGVNGATDENGRYTEGTDYDLDEAFFDAWNKTFDNCRKNGCMIAVRFRYDDIGRDNPEPASFEKVLDHVKQIKESGIFQKNSDILAFVECGFVGKWGEQHGGKYTDTEHKAKLLDAMLDAVPQNVPVTVRTPDIFAEWAGIKRSQLDDEELFAEGGNERLLCKRVGMYNDGYMGSSSDLGTFSDREKETNWLRRVTEETYYGGEFSGNIEFAKEYDTYLPENAVPEMYKTRLSYINGNIFQLYKDYVFGSEYDIGGVDNSAYYGQSVFQFIRDHLGYRFVLRKSEHSASTEQGGELEMNFSVENTGFANAVFKPKAYLILEKDGKFYESAMPVSVHDWKSCMTSENSLKWHLPENIETGKWNIYMRISAVDDNCGEPLTENGLILPKYGIRFANKDVWNSRLGANYLGSFEVTEAESHGSDNSLYELTSETHSDSFPLTFGDMTVVDGEISPSDEWQDKDIAAEKNGNSVSVKADDRYLYVMAEMPDGAKAPVYNLEVRSGGETYWLYYASNGFVYFNHGSYAGCQCRWNGNTAEFRVPFEVMGLKSGAQISSLRVFLQDSGADWEVLGDVTAADVTVPSDFPVYSAEYDLYMARNASHTLRAECIVPDIKYQWYHNDNPIENAAASEYTVSTADETAFGNYSVKITTAGGLEKTVSIANVKETTKADGDANCDGAVDMGDVVLIMQSLANPDKYGVNGTDAVHRITAQGIRNGDIEGNGNGLTVSDALAIQRILLGL